MGLTVGVRGLLRSVDSDAGGDRAISFFADDHFAADMEGVGFYRCVRYEC